jgi:glycosyltransferase involved in cell wall biosynthesis
MPTTLHSRDERAGEPRVAGGPVDPADPVRVLFVWDHLGYPNGAAHGLTRYCVNVLPRLNGGQVEMTACFLREPHPAGAELSRRGLDPIFLDRRKWDPRALLDVLRLIRRHRIDIVHAVGQKGVLVGRTAGRISGCGTIVHLRDVFPMSLPVRYALRAGAPWTDVAQGVSRAVCRHATDRLAIPAEKVRLLYNGILPDDFKPLEPGEAEEWRRRNGFGVSERLVGVVGRLAPEKGHLRMIRQLGRIAERFPDVRLVIAGEGPLRGRIEREIRARGLTERVRLLGPRDDARALIGALDVLAVPSDHEGLSFVALEALMLGTPVVGTAIGGLAEVLGGGRYGMLFRPQEEDSLGDAVLKVLSEPEAARERARASATHLRMFDMDAHVDAQREIYLDLAARVRARRPAGRMRAA